MWTCPGWRQGGLGLRHSWPTSEGNLPSCGQSGPGWLPNIPVINIYTVGPLSLIWGWSHHSLLFRLQEMQRSELSSSHQYSGPSVESFLWNKVNILGKIRTSSISFLEIRSDYFRDVTTDICDDCLLLSHHGACWYSRGSQSQNRECFSTVRQN